MEGFQLKRYLYDSGKPIVAFLIQSEICKCLSNVLYKHQTSCLGTVSALIEQRARYFKIDKIKIP